MNASDTIAEGTMPASPHLDPVSVVELRRYRLRPGSRETLIDLFDREFVETQEEAGMHVIGQFRNLDAPDSFIWLRGFSDMASRRKALQAFYSGPVWAEHRDAANGTMVNSDNVLLLRPLSLEKAFRATDTGRPPRDAKGSRPGLVVATVAHLAPRTDSAFADFFIRDVSPVLSQAGATVLGTFVVERSENTFPRLPVREGETVFVWFSLFRDEVAYDAHIDALAASREWTERILPEMDGRVWRPNKISRLTPTARSLIHGESLSSVALNTPCQGRGQMKLLPGPLSLFSRKVEIALHEKGLTFERVMVPFSQTEGYSPKHPVVLATNPKGQVPVLLDGDLAIYDSTVIIEYLDDAYPHLKLLHGTAVERAHCRLYDVFADEILLVSLKPLMHRTTPSPRDPERWTALEREAHQAEAVLDRHFAYLSGKLEGRDFLCVSFGASDIAVFMAVLFALRLGGVSLDDHSALAGWYRRLLERPAFASVAGEIAAADRELSAPVKGAYGDGRWLP